MLFYRPHNASLLIDCKYPFTKEAQQALSEEIKRGAKAGTELEQHKDWQYWLTQRQQQALQAEVDGQGVRLQVADRGAGIPDYARERVFERFYSLARPGSGRRSSGLGLPFVQEVARLHDGRASLDDRDGGGTVASLWLPLAVPVRYIAGVPDGTSLRSRQYLAEAGVPCVAIQNAGHWPFLDQPCAFADSLNAFLDDHA